MTAEQRAVLLNVAAENEWAITWTLKGFPWRKDGWLVELWTGGGQRLCHAAVDPLAFELRRDDVECSLVSVTVANQAYRVRWANE